MTTARRCYREGTLPVPARKVARLILLSLDTAAATSPQGGADLYARMSSHNQKAGQDSQVARLTAWATRADLPVVRVEAGVGYGMNGTRVRAGRLLVGLADTVVVVEHRSQLGRMNTGLAEAALAADGRRLSGRRSVRNRALKAVGCAQRDIGPRAALAAGSVPYGGGR